MPLISTLANASSRGYGMFGGAAPFVLEGNYYSIATVTVPSGGMSSVTFAGVPSDYKHLQLRFIGKSTIGGTSGSDFAIQFNGDTSANYKGHQLYGTGASVASEVTDGTSSLYIAWIPQSGITGFGGYVMDLLDYQSTTKNKTVRSFGGWDNNGSGFVIFRSGHWRSTSAVTSMTIIQPSGSIAEGSQFALYGVK